MLRRAVGLLGAGLLALAGVVVGAPAQAAGYAGACNASSPGVTVVVAFPSGGSSTRCAPGTPTSGAAALAQAGFGFTRDQGFPGVVCRINNLPADGMCVRMPPANAYWASWHAKSGGGWSYGQQGFDSYHPACGSVEGWAFGAGVKPPAAPVTAACPTPTPKPKPSPKPVGSSTPTPTTGTGSTTPASGAPTATGRPSPATGASANAPAKHRKKARVAVTPSPSPRPSAATTPSTGPTTSDPTATSETPAAQGAGVPWWVGTGLIVVLGAAGGTLAWWRRRA